jgi:hypothetical protein
VHATALCVPALRCTQGVHTSFDCLLALRQAHGFAFDKSDLFMLCALRIQGCPASGRPDLTPCARVRDPVFVIPSPLLLRCLAVAVPFIARTNTVSLAFFSINDFSCLKSCRQRHLHLSFTSSIKAATARSA